jgi:hypothetical protein
MKRLLAGAVGLATTGVLAPAAAQGVDEFGAYGVKGRELRESPQNIAVEIRFGPYRPRVDTEFDGATPFEDTFGKDKRYLFGFEVDWQLLRIPKLGTLGPGFGWGFTKFDGFGFRQVDGSRSEEETSFKVMPMYLVGVLRVDVLARETPVPLVGYGKLGLGAAPWWASHGGGTSRTAGQVGRSISYGYQFALGAMLLLDPLDREAAIELDSNAGVNNSYLFFEWYFSDLDDFGGDEMQVGANTWFLGLALEL